MQAFIFSFLVDGVALAVMEFYFYYAYGRKQPIILILGGLLTLVLLAIAAMAAYESFKHRHDRDPW